MDAGLSLILASASPRRRQLLLQLGAEFTVIAADIDETPHAAEQPEHYVARMATEKADCVALRHPLSNGAVLAADTCVVIDEDILGKPRDHLDALAMLARLSGRQHSVLTALCLQTHTVVETVVVTTRVQFLQLSRELCEAYLATDEPWDKAGAYAIQGLGGALVKSISGSYSNVVGLPLVETGQLLARHGVTWRLGAAYE